MLVEGSYSSRRLLLTPLFVIVLQRTRLKAVESLRKDSREESRTVVVCTDVAARGLDIPSVSTVVHYNVARAVDTFVHRAGRTAVSQAAGTFCSHVVHECLLGG